MAETSNVVNATERPEDTVRRYAHKLVAIEGLHEQRRLDGDGFTSIWCRECRQNWPCPTIQTMQSAGERARSSCGDQGD